MTTNEVLSLLKNVKRSGDRWTARCPAHDDHKPSLSIKDSDDGGVLLYCFAKCSLEDVCTSLGIEPRDLRPGETRSKYPVRTSNGERSNQQAASESSGPSTTYDYTDEQGRLLFQVVRYEPKDFRQRQPNGNGGWRWNLTGVRRVLYRLPEILAADRSAMLFIVEGEKDADRLAALGLCATTCPGGAGKWHAEYNEPLRNQNACILADNDRPGREHSEKVADSLHGVAASMRILVLPNLPDKGDVSDWFDAGGTAEELRRLAATTTAWAPNHSREVANSKSRFAFSTLDEILAEPEEETSYVWDLTLPCGGFSICASKPKVGKSTLVRNLAVAVARGEPFFGRPTKRGKVIYLCLEEKRAEIKRHFRRMGASGADIIIHTGSTPIEALEALATALEEHSPALVIIDPLSRFVRLTDFNNYAEVTRELEPIIDLARESACQCHLLGLHHNGKEIREGGDSVLGSTGFFGAVDALLTMKKRQGVRTLETTQRYGEDLPETVVYLDTETGIVTPDGDMRTRMLNECKAAILDCLGEEPSEEKDIKERVGGTRGVTSKALRVLHEEGQIIRAGKGKRGDPYLYQKAAKALQAADDNHGTMGLPIPSNLENPEYPETIEVFDL